ncbi:hypothetical protein PPL_00446 [Heterostelium album PN500]|uniref:Uncharacterized protein n=1 Tax=Heterostelium pallidum (strain ATCC 26659 / Pp 5 / PN500) TaxID=670386 RepID=D3AWH2_HETP5|nr:hypothetical protein PPL_00446 [Heterostelium album PN500]EFA86645.1 hypothetical protein PPL_00446 [Heterostelium album PN500]|eukprot:XP_020438750.1 hypothetical protein PPL_00446 [Heterostelium album PN500]
MGKSIGTICSLKFAGELFPKPNKNGSVNNSSNNNSNSNKNINVTPRKEESIYAEMPLGGLILVSSFGPSGLSENIYLPGRLRRRDDRVCSVVGTGPVQQPQGTRTPTLVRDVAQQSGRCMARPTGAVRVHQCLFASRLL